MKRLILLILLTLPVVGNAQTKTVTKNSATNNLVEPLNGTSTAPLSGTVTIGSGTGSSVTLSALVPGGATTGQALTFNGTNWVPGGPFGSGTVTSVSVSGGSYIGVSGSPITGSGTISLSLSSAVTTQGNVFNGANQLTILDANGSLSLPANTSDPSATGTQALVYHHSEGGSGFDRLGISISPNQLGGSSNYLFNANGLIVFPSPGGAGGYADIYLAGNSNGFGGDISGAAGSGVGANAGHISFNGGSGSGAYSGGLGVSGGAGTGAYGGGFYATGGSASGATGGGVDASGGTTWPGGLLNLKDGAGTITRGNGVVISLPGASSQVAYTSTSIPTSGIAKFSGSGLITQATSGTDYAPATTGSAILYGNGSGGFSSVSIGTNLSFSAGTLSASGGSGGGGTITLSGDVSGSGTSAISTTVTRINGVALSGLATGILKNTTTTGVPSIAVASDFPTLNQNTTGTAGSLSAPLSTANLYPNLSAALSSAFGTTNGGILSVSSGTFTSIAAGSAGYVATSNGAGSSWSWQPTSNSVIIVPSGRLTLTSGVAITTSDVSAATTVYYTPCSGQSLPIYNGSSYVQTSFSELSLPLDSSSGHTGYQSATTNFDCFVINDSGTIRLGTGPAWTSSTSRGTGAGTTELQLLNGIWNNKNSILIRFGSASGNTISVSVNQATYVGTIRTVAAGNTEDSNANRFVWNCYNQTHRVMRVTEGTSSWTYSTATVRQANANSANQLNFIMGLTGGQVESELVSVTGSTSAQAISMGIGVDTITILNWMLTANTVSASGFVTTTQKYRGYPSLGYHYLAWLEQGAGSGTQTWYGLAYSEICGGIFN